MMTEITYYAAMGKYRLEQFDGGIVVAAPVFAHTEYVECRRLRVRCFGAIFPEIGESFALIAQVVERFAGKTVAFGSECRHGA